MPGINIAGLLAGLAAAGMAGFFLFQGMNMNPETARFPIMVASVMAVLVLFLGAEKAWAIIRERRNAVRRDESTPRGIGPGRYLSPFVLVVLCVLFLVILKPVGFEISALLLMAGSMLLMNPRQAMGKAYMVVVTPLVMIVLFKLLLGLRIPSLIDRLFG